MQYRKKTQMGSNWALPTLLRINVINIIKVLAPCFVLCRFFDKQKRFETSFHDSITAWFLTKKNSSHAIFYQVAKFPWLLGILGNLCNYLICDHVCDIVNFETTLSSAIQPFFYITKKSGQKYFKNKKSC